MANRLARKLGVAVGITAFLTVATLGMSQLSASAASTDHPAAAQIYSLLDEEGGLALPLGVLPESPESSGFSVNTEGDVNQAVGFYSNGSLVNDSDFPLEGDGFVKILRPKKRWYGTFDIRAVVEYAAAELHHDFPGGERIQIGDVAQDGGGPVGHISHENGLDADLVYMRENHEEQDPYYISSTPTGFQENFVVPPAGQSGSGTLSPNFDLRRNWALVKYLHSTGRVVRIFMDPVIKAALCHYARAVGEYESEADTLRRIRPLADHQEHMHVRITCPTHSPSCQAQLEPPSGTGCDDVFSLPAAAEASPGFGPGLGPALGND